MPIMQQLGVLVKLYDCRQCRDTSSYRSVKIELRRLYAPTVPAQPVGRAAGEAEGQRANARTRGRHARKAGAVRAGGGRPRQDRSRGQGTPGYSERAIGERSRAGWLLTGRARANVGRAKG